MVPKSNITGLILAGGAGRRVDGRDKGLIPWRGKPLIAHVCDRLKPQIGELLVSCNRNHLSYKAYSDVVITDSRQDFQGPLAGLDPTIRQLLWDKVSETQPLQFSEAIMSLGIVFLVLPFLTFRMGQGITMLSKHQGIIWFIGAAIFIPLSLYELRWTPYASIVLLIPYVECVRRTLGWIEKRWPQRRGEGASLIFGLILLFWPITIGTVVALGQPKPEPSTIGEKCPLLPLGEYLTVLTQNAAAPKTILAFKDFGPELLYRTSHRIVGTPMHRNSKSFGDSLAIMKAKNPWNAQQIIQRRQIDLILICLNSKVEADFYMDSSSDSTNNFYGMLIEGMYPTWLNEVVLPEKLKESFRLFEVVKSNMFLDS